MRHWNHEGQTDVEVISGCFWMARRQAIEVVGNLDERFFFYAEDVDWCKRFADAGWRLVFLPQACATHFGGGSSLNAPFRYSIELLRSNLAYWRKHRGITGQVTYYLLSVTHHSIRLVARSLKAFGRSGASPDTAFKYRRSLLCLRWLPTGKQV